MAAHQAQHQANQLAQVVHQIRAEAQGFHGQVVLRFDNIDHAIATLQDRYEALSQKTEKRHINMEGRLTKLDDKILAISESLVERVLPAVTQGTRAIQDTLKDQIGPAIQRGVQAIQNTLTNQLRPVQNTVDSIRDTLDNLDLHVVQPVNTAVHHAETVILGRIGELQNLMPGTIQGNLEQAINSSETRIRDRIDHGHQEANVAHNHATSQARDAIITAVVGAQNAISARLHHTAELEITYQNVLDAVEATRHEVRAGHSNNAARLANKFASCCNNRIATFRGIDDKRIAGFPTTYADFRNLHGHTDYVLEQLGLSTHGAFSSKKQRLKIFLGLRK